MTLKNKKAVRIAGEIVLIIFASFLSSVTLYTFVNPAGFAPSGIDGIAIMTQKLTGISMGYVSLAINIPLLLIAWFSISKKYVAYTAIFTVISSVSIIVMERIDMYEYISASNVWIAVFASGIMLGTRTGIMVKIGGSSGGVDIIACIIQRKRPYLNIENLISAFCYIIIALSFFVYGNLESVVMSVAQMMIFNVAMNRVLKSTRNAVEVKIITDNAVGLKNDILRELKHGATIMDCRGMFTDAAKQMIVTVINIHQMNELIKISKKYPTCFMYFGEASGVWGNFRWRSFDDVK